MIKRAYASCRFGQLHYHIAGTSDGGKPPLLCLHMTPYSGSYYHAFQEAMATDRMVICPDNPGYGGSDAPKAKPSIADYAGAAADLVEGLGLENIDVLGFHTGAFIAAELAISNISMVARLITPGIPYMPADKRQGLREKFAAPRPYFSEDGYMEGRWKMALGAMNGKSEDRTLSEFAETLQPGTKANWGFEAVFGYDPDARFPLITQPVHIPLPDEQLSDASKAAAKIIPNHTTYDWPDLDGSLFDQGAELTAARIRKILD